MLSRFVATADTHRIGDPPYGSARDIIIGELSQDYQGLTVKGSFGMGRAAAVPWIGFFGFSQRTEDGIYPVYLYFKNQGKIVLAYGISETREPETGWAGVEGQQTIKQWFLENDIGEPGRYGNSLVAAVYDAHALPNEAELHQDLSGVIQIFKQTFATAAEPGSAFDTAVYSALATEKIQSVLAATDFYFEKGRQKLEEFRNYSATPEDLRQLLSEYRASNLSPSDYLSELDDGLYRHVFTLVGELVSYIDEHAANKAIYNEYPDKRTMAGSAVRQNVWVDQLIRYKAGEIDNTQFSPNVKNAIAYLDNPGSEVTMLSEDHRALVSKRILGKTYEKAAFVGDLLAFFGRFDIQPANPVNLTRVVSSILYDKTVKPFWHQDRPEPPRPQPQPAELVRPEPSRTKSITYRDPLRMITQALKAKPFVLLAGLSGTGKSRLARTLAFKCCSDPRLRTDSRKPGNFELVPVRPNWHDSSEVVGYISRLSGVRYVPTTFLRFLVKAWSYPEVPFFLCLDEMNLAPVEQYFAEYLSIIETRTVIGDEVVSDFLISPNDFENPSVYSNLLADLGVTDSSLFESGIALPANLSVIGTVNMDETTHSFSRKVLDRAMTIEMNRVELSDGLEGDDILDWSFPEVFVSPSDVIGTFTDGRQVYERFVEAGNVVSYLRELNDLLDGTPFKVAYRVRDEFLIYCYNTSLLGGKPDDWLARCLDEMTVMKVLSRIEGDAGKTGKIIERLAGFLAPDSDSGKKLQTMQQRLTDEGYTSFWA